MTITALETIQDLIHYYNHHKVEAMQKSHPGFVTEDFTQLLALLERECLTTKGATL